MSGGASLAERTFAMAAACRRACSEADLRAAAEPLLSELGFETWGVFEVVTDGASVRLRQICAVANPEWQAVYVGEGLFRHDPRTRFARDLPGPFFLSDVLAEATLGPDERRFLDRAAVFNTKESYLYPHRTANHRTFASVLGGAGTAITDDIRTASSVLACCLLLEGLRLEGVRIRSEAKPQLNDRQRQCLELVRLGKSSSDIGDILSISPRTVDAHLAVVCDRFGVRTRIQAVSKALDLGLLPHSQA